MDNWLTLFDEQTRYTLEINNSPVTPDVLMKYATLRQTKRTMAAAPVNMPLPIPLLPGQYPPLNETFCIEYLLNTIKTNDAIVQGA
ncbi:MAG: hypothetical protein LBS13_20870 [Enterobacter cloacae]|jgi:hypothetical protein|nr:hypothetical protein [Enterobacter cloacae]